MTPVDASGDLVQMVRTHDLSLTAGLHIVALTGGQWHGGLAAQGDARPRLLGLREVVSRANSGGFFCGRAISRGRLVTPAGRRRCHPARVEAQNGKFVRHSRTLTTRTASAG